MQERGLEFNALSEIAQQVRNGNAAGFVQQALRGAGAGRIGDLRLAPTELAKRRRQHR